MSVYDPCTQKIKACDDFIHLLSTNTSINSLVNISSNMQQIMKLILFFLLIYFSYQSAIELYCTCAASVMDSTQDSGSWDVGSTPTWRIIKHRYISHSPEFTIIYSFLADKTLMTFDKLLKK